MKKLFNLQRFYNLSVVFFFFNFVLISMGAFHYKYIHFNHIHCAIHVVAVIAYYKLICSL